MRIIYWPIFLIHAANALKTALKLLYCIPDAFKITFHYTFSRVFKLEYSLNVKHCYEFIVAYPICKKANCCLTRSHESA